MPERQAPLQVELFEQPSFASVSKWYVAEYLSRQADDTRKTQASICKIALESFQARGIAHPKKPDWISYLRGRVERAEISANTARTHRKVLHHVYEFGRDSEKWPVLANPLKGIEDFKAVKDDAPIYIAKPDTTYPALIAAMPDPISKALVSVCRRQGLRISEALGIEPDHVDFRRGFVTIAQQRKSIHVTPSRLKTDVSMATMKLHPEAAELLHGSLRYLRERLAAPRGKQRAFIGDAARRYVFPFYTAQLNGLMEICRKVAPTDFPRRIVGVDGGNAWHVFRHTFARSLLDRGMPVEELHVWLRHKNPATTHSYIKSLRGPMLADERVNQYWEAEAAAEKQAAWEREGAALKPVPLLRSVGTVRHD